MIRYFPRTDHGGFRHLEKEPRLRENRNLRYAKQVKSVNTLPAPCDGHIASASSRTVTFVSEQCRPGTCMDLFRPGLKQNVTGI